MIYSRIIIEGRFLRNFSNNIKSFTSYLFDFIRFVGFLLEEHSSMRGIEN